LRMAARGSEAALTSEHRRLYAKHLAGMRRTTKVIQKQLVSPEHADREHVHAGAGQPFPAPQRLVAHRINKTFGPQSARGVVLPADTARSAV
jgi:hypothetical protein